MLDMRTYLLQGAQDLSDVLEAKMGGAAAGPTLADIIQKVCCEVIYIFTLMFSKSTLFDYCHLEFSLLVIKLSLITFKFLIIICKIDESI